MHRCVDVKARDVRICVMRIMRTFLRIIMRCALCVKKALCVTHNAYFLHWIKSIFNDKFSVVAFTKGDDRKLAIDKSMSGDVEKVLPKWK